MTQRHQRTKMWFVCFSFLLAMFGSNAARADMGPKPTMAISLPDNLPDQVVDGELLLCKDPFCLIAKPLEAAGPQNFSCGGRSCSGRAYGFASFMQLKLIFATHAPITSHVFSKKAFDAKFKASYEEGSLKLLEE